MANLKRPAGSDARAARRLSALWDDFNRKRRDQGLRPMTQAEAGKRLDMTQSSVGQYLRGDIALGVTAVLKWATLLGVPHSAIRDDLAELKTIPDSATLAGDVRYAPLVYTGDEIAALLAGTRQPTKSWPLMSEPGGIPYSPNVFTARLDTNALAPHAHKGDLIVCDPDTRAQPGELACALAADQQLVVGSLWRNPDGSATLRPPAPEYPASILPAETPVWRIAAVTRFL